jgi:hypothetical protein
MNRIISTLWPSFIVAAAANAVFFTVIDPRELYLFGQPVEFGRLATYSIGFFLFWAVTAASSAFSLLLHMHVDRSADLDQEPARPPT